MPTVLAHGTGNVRQAAWASSALAKRRQKAFLCASICRSRAAGVSCCAWSPFFSFAQGVDAHARDSPCDQRPSWVQENEENCTAA